MIRDSIPASVVIPTVGRLPHLEECLRSIAECEHLPEEILVVDQSRASDVPAVVSKFASIGVRAIECAGRGISLGMNLGLREAKYEVVLVTHDDCTVAQSWVSVAWSFMSADPQKIVTGRVIPAGDDPRAVPSTKDDPNPHDFTGQLYCAGLYPNNMVLNRSMVLALGGFDERFDTSAEDNDLCYRWLRAGNRLLYEPTLVVRHHDVRPKEDLESVYVNYWRGQGRFYAKHLRQGDRAMLYFMWVDAKNGLRAMGDRLLHGRPRWSDPRRGMARGLPRGLLEGWRRFG
jgi:GT2 family glycosyltransferase